MGIMNAQLAASVTGMARRSGSTFVLFPIPITTGRRTVTKATFDINSVAKTAKVVSNSTKANGLKSVLLAKNSPID